jgi:putative transposase
MPHWYIDGAPLFVTWRLHGSLPQGLYPPPQKASQGEAFVWIDRYLDAARSGPVFLRQPAIAQLVVNSLSYGRELGHYDLHAWVVMANHVHVLLTPKYDPTRSIASLKGATARKANQLLGRTGQPFWQAEWYDHWVRNENEFQRIWRYIESNPVRAGLVRTPEAFPGRARMHAAKSCGTAAKVAARHLKPVIWLP